MLSISSHDRTRRVPRGRARIALVLSFALGLALFIGACSSAAAPILSNVGNSVPGGAANGVTAGPAAAPSAAPAAPGGNDFSGNGGTTGSTAQDLTDQSYIVKTGSLTIEVPEIDPALLRARTAIAGLGGYISGSNQTTEGDQVIASVTYRFPAARWEDALDAIRGLATKVVGLKTDSTEVTGQVIDLGARIDNLRATEQALQAIMTKATKIQDILDVQNQLTSVQGQIEELSTQQSHLKDQASLSTLTVLFQTPVPTAVKVTTKGWDPGAEFDQAVSQILGLGQGVATAGIWLVVVVLPVVIVLAVLFLILSVLARRFGWRLIPRPMPPVPPMPPAVPPAMVGGGPEA
jgi:Domain of unknown function (DUF4349)